MGVDGYGVQTKFSEMLLPKASPLDLCLSQGKPFKKPECFSACEWDLVLISERFGDSWSLYFDLDLRTRR